MNTTIGTIMKLANLLRDDKTIFADYLCHASQKKRATTTTAQRTDFFRVAVFSFPPARNERELNRIITNYEQ